jgi:multidrug efflux pump subunit AcrA (membrane-fusion protein)
MSDSNLETTDWVLGQLEAIARNADPQNQFYPRLTQSLLPLLNADCVLLAIELESKPLVLFSSGNSPDPESLQAALQLAFAQQPSSGSLDPNPLDPRSPPPHRALSAPWICVRFPKNNPSKPLAILARFANLPGHEQLAGAKNLLDALAEIAELREVYVENHRAVGLWKQAILRSEDLTNAQSHPQLHRGLVEALRELLQADRVSLFQKDHQAASMIACSGAASIDSNSTTVQELEKSVLGLFQNNEPKLWNAADDQRQAPRYRLLLPWPSNSDSLTHGLLVEWSDPQATIDRVQRASNLLPMINQAWQYQYRWLCLPTRARSQAIGKSASQAPAGRFPKRLAGLALLASLVALAMIPYPFYIQTQAYLEPTTQQFIHATADSFIEELLVGEGQSVQSHQPLLRLRAPNLELQIEELTGQILALVEKKNGLRVAVNQLSANSSDLANQTRLSAELRLIEIQEKHAQEKLAFLEKQRQELLLQSPIKGIVVGGDLSRELSDRPLQRGDALFRVADLQGPWHLKLLVADRDGRYVQQALLNGPIDIDWGLENATGRGLKAKLISMRPEVDQRPNQGPCRSATASIDESQLEQPAIGAVAYARIPCGKQPLWFIWSRPLVEFLQKRFWFNSSP